MNEIQRMDRLTPIQEGLLYHLINNEDQEGAYIEQFIVSMTGNFHYEKFVESLGHATEKHESLRTSFVYEEVDQSVRVIMKNRNIPVFYKDISFMSESEMKLEIEKRVKEENRKVFNVAEDSLIRISIFSTGHNSFSMIWSYHHVLIDGYSFQLLLKDILYTYEHNLLSFEASKTTIGTSDEGYIAWLSSQDWESASDFWSSYLENYETDNRIPRKRQWEADKQESYKKIEVRVNSDLMESLRSLAKKHRVTTNVIFQAIWAVMLQRYTNSEDVVYGLVTSLRNPTIPEIENAVGVFINTIPVRVQSDPSITLSELIKNIQEDSFYTREYSYYPLHQIQAENAMNQELINHILIFNNNSDLSAEDKLCQDLNRQLSAVQVKEISYTSKTHYSLEVEVNTFTNKASIVITYDSNIYDSKLIKSFEGHFLKIAELLTENDQIQLRELNFITDREKDCLLVEFNSNRDMSIQQYRSVFNMFEEQVKLHPDRTAVISSSRSMNYEKLHSESIRLANFLLNEDLSKGDVIGLLYDRSEYFIISILAILRSGFRYVPLDPDAPFDRNDYISQDSGAKMLLSERMTWDEKGWQNHSIHLCLLDELTLDSSSDSNVNTKLDDVSPIDGAYIIYTSGTTGRPKGVEIQHKSIINLAVSLSNELYAPFDYKLNIAQLAPFFFDQSMEEIFGSLLLGHTLVIATNDVRLDNDELLTFLNKHSIDMMNGSPSYIRSLFYKKECPPTLRRLLVGGETVPYQLLEDIFSSFGSEQLEIFNVYGPTECCVDATYYKVDLEEIKQLRATPIGRPMANKRAYILDKFNRLQPIGIPGELVIGGEGIATGYVHLPGMTEEKFIQDSFIPNEIAYRTGDQARWLPDGNIEFLGRNDRLVKLHGYRIELEEIEERLLANTDVKEATVILKEELGRKFLCAFIVAVGEQQLTEYGLKQWVSQVLPHYMNPTMFVFLEELPLSATGKVDRNTLAKIEISSDDSTAPSSLLESEIIKLWEEILQIEDIKPHDHFFEIGGHSLYATMFISKLKKEMGKRASIKELFLYPTPAEFAKLIRQKEPVESTDIVNGDRAMVHEQQYYLLTSAQTRLFLMYQMNKQSTKYNISGKFRINHSLEIQKILECFNTLLRQHEILRTSFANKDGNFVQTIHPALEMNIHAWKEEPDIRQWVKPFVLDAAPLMRVSVFEIDQNSFDLFIDMHHIITDGISNALLIDQFIKLYKGEYEEASVVPFKNYALWHQEYLASDRYKNDEAYWINRLEGELPEVTLPLDYSRKQEQEGKAETIWVDLDPALTSSLRNIAMKQHSTLFSLLLASYNVLTYKYTGQEEVIVGTTVSGRTHQDTQESIGLFVNTIVLRNYPTGDKSFVDFLTEISESLMDDLDHQDYPFDLLLDRLSIVRNRGRNPVFDVMFTMQNRTHIDASVAKQDFLAEYNVESSEAKFDLIVEAYEYNDTIRIKLEFNKDLYQRETVEQHGKYFFNLLKSIASNPKENIAHLPIMQPDELSEMLSLFDRSTMSYPEKQTIHGLFEKQVCHTPNHIAITDQKQSLTYEELNRRANQLANVLRKNGTKAETVVGIFMEKSIDAIVSILAVLKAGGAYLPINTDHPKDLVEYIIDDSQAAILITNSSDSWDAVGKLSKVIYEKELDETLLNEDDKNLELDVKSNQLSYMIYTSGTTGKPKGVMIEHSDVVRLFENEQPLFSFTDQEVWTLFHSLSFDYSVWEMYGALLKGGKLVIVPKETIYNTKLFMDLLVREKVTVLNQTPASFYVLSMFIQEASPELSLKYIIIAAEALHPKKLIHFRRAYPHIKLINMYGITETTVFTTYKELTSYEIENDSRSVGTPIPTFSLYVFDRNQQLCPRGGIGELYVGGQGIARGYLNREEMNREKFIDNPFRPGQRLYRSGDLMRLLNNDELEYIGRIDHQVKIRGYRIELAEIEKALMDHPFVHETVVLSVGDYPNNYLCAFYVSGNEQYTTHAELKQYLKPLLPAYSIPLKYVHLKELPLTVNGKLHRKKLIQLAEVTKDESKVLPQSDLEQEISLVWSALLGIDDIGIDDDFFELGGNSLQAVQLANHLEKTFYKPYTITDVFQNPTISALAKMISGSMERKGLTPITAYQKRAYYPLSYAQNRIFLLSQNPNIGMAYNMVSKFDLYGRLDTLSLKDAIKSLINRHDMLRTSFKYEKGVPVQYISNAEPAIFWYEANLQEQVRIIQQFLQPFDVTSGNSLFSVAIIRLNEEHHTLLFNMHHLISDGFSMKIMEQDLISLLKGVELSPLELQYQDYTIWQNEYYQGQIKDSDEKYWLGAFNDFNEEEGSSGNSINISNIQSYKGAKYSTNLPQNMLKRLKILSNTEKTTVFNTLLAIYKLTLNLLWDRQEIVVGSPVSGRSNPQFSNVIGMFVNTLAIRSFPKRAHTFKEYIQQLKEIIFNALKHQDYPFDHLVEKLGVQFTPGRTPLFDSTFSYEKTMPSEFDINGLKVVLDETMSDGAAMFDFSFTIIENEDLCKIQIEYNTQHFRADMAEWIAQCYMNLAEKVINDPDLKLNEIELQDRNANQTLTKWDELQFDFDF